MRAQLARIIPLGMMVVLPAAGRFTARKGVITVRVTAVNGVPAQVKAVVRHGREGIDSSSSMASQYFSTSTGSVLHDLDTLVVSTPSSFTASDMNGSLELRSLGSAKLSIVVSRPREKTITRQGTAFVIRGELGRVTIEPIR